MIFQITNLHVQKFNIRSILLAKILKYLFKKSAFFTELHVSSLVHFRCLATKICTKYAYKLRHFIVRVYTSLPVCSNVKILVARRVFTNLVQGMPLNMETLLFSASIKAEEITYMKAKFPNVVFCRRIMFWVLKARQVLEYLAEMSMECR
jgi:hypothetical protein